MERRRGRESENVLPGHKPARFRFFLRYVSFHIMITTSRTYKAVAPSHSSPGCKHTALSTSTFWTHTKFAYSGLSDHGFQTCSKTLKVTGGQAESCTHSQVSKATAALNEHAAACAHFNGHPGGCRKVCAAQGSPATDGEKLQENACSLAHRTRSNGSMSTSISDSGVMSSKYL